MLSVEYIYGLLKDLYGKMILEGFLRYGKMIVVLLKIVNLK